MGWEYHQRHRLNGKFVPDVAWNAARNCRDQIHIRVEKQLGRKIREAAAGDGKELTEWVLDACRAHLENRNRKRANVGRPPV